MNYKMKEDYALLLADRLKQLINENKAERNRYRMIKAKMDREKLSVRNLTSEEQSTYYKYGVKNGKSALERVRIELNTILKELIKEEGCE